MSDTNNDRHNTEVVDDEPMLVLASDMLPEEILILPGAQKPIFPGMVFPIIVQAGPAAKTLVELVENGQEAVVGIIVAVESPNHDETLRTHYHKVGTAARILNLKRDPHTGAVQVLLQGMRRFEVLQLAEKGDRLSAFVMYLQEHPADGDDVKAMTLAILNTMREMMKNHPLFAEEIKTLLSRQSWDDPGQLADFSVAMTSSSADELQEILECLDIRERLEKALFLLRRDLDLNQLKEKITHQIEEKISRQQREFFLNEQLKAIKNELGLEKDDKAEEVAKYEERVAQIKLSDEARQRFDQELTKLKVLNEQSPEYAVIRNYLDWLTELPWGIYSEDYFDIDAARVVLDRDHYGLKDVKDRIIEFIGVSKLRGSVEGSILCLVGPPGVGKTSLGRGIAEALGREFFRFSLGGMRDEAEIKGHRRTYVGAMPGKLIQTVKSTGTQNPVIMLDEIDKIGMSYHGDPASALLEVLDPEQNHDFLDHYLDVRFNLSKVLFIATANIPDTIPAALLDRMEVIRLAGYTLHEKLLIAKRHLIRRQLPLHGLTSRQIRFTDSGIRAIIHGYAREAGVRGLEKAIRGCMRKVAMKVAEDPNSKRVTVSTKNVETLLGRPHYHDEALMKKRHPGVITGLAWTALGGTILNIEAMAIPGQAGLRQTGQLGDVMIESTSIAFSMVKANARKFGIDPDFFNEHTIHIHVPAGATPKDGPSAGITMATALISMALAKPPPKRLAMTGELTLTGHVLAVGGIREKVVAAGRSGIRSVILPQANEKDFEDIPDDVRSGISAHFVATYRDVFRLIFEDGLDIG